MQRVSPYTSFGFAAMLVHKLDERYQGSLFEEKAQVEGSKEFCNLENLASQPFQPSEQMTNESLAAVEKYTYICRIT